MTNEEAEKILFYHRSTGNLSPMLNEALDLAISALSKQSASTGAKLFDGHGVWLEPGELFLGENLIKKVIDQTAQNDEAKPDSDHIADSGKIIKLEKRTITERLIIAESLINSVIADSDQFRDSAKMSAADYKAQVKVLADVLDSCPLTEPCDLMWRPTGWCKEHCKDGQDSPDAECWMRYARVMTENKTESDKMVDQFRDSAKKTDSEMNCDEWWKNYIRSRMSRDDVPDTNVGDMISRQAAIDAEDGK